MDSTERAHRKRTDDVFRKSSSVLSFISILLIVALLLRMEMINKRTQINELRILAVESRMKTANEADKNVEDKLKTFRGTCKYKTIYFDPNDLKLKYDMN